MDIILLEKIENLGGIGEKVSVKSGYARNYLIPKGKATIANEENLLKFEKQRSELEEKASILLKKAQNRAASIENKTLAIKANVGSEGKLFGSIGTQDIIDACKAVDVDIERSEIRMPDGPIKTAGEHNIDLHFHSDVSVAINVVIESTDDPQSIEYSSVDSDNDDDNPS